MERRQTDDADREIPERQSSPLPWMMWILFAAGCGPTVSSAARRGNEPVNPDATRAPASSSWAPAAAATSAAATSFGAPPPEFDIAVSARLCDDGDLLACVRCGQRLERGAGTSRDLVGAFIYYSIVDLYGMRLSDRSGLLLAGAREEVRAALPATSRHLAESCKAGTARACTHLALLLELFSRPDGSELRLYERACGSGHGYGCYRRAVLADPELELGVKVQKDGALAADFYARSCDHGGFGCNNLGRIYENGTGVARDTMRAARLYEKECSFPQRDAGCSNLARVLAEGIGVPADPGRARVLFERLCTSGYHAGCVGLGRLYIHGKGVPLDSAHAVVLFERACAGGESGGCDNLAPVLERSDRPDDLRRAADLYEKGCAVGRTISCYGLANMRRYGKGGQRDPTGAAALHERNCAAGELDSCVAASAMYRGGQGVPGDQKRAVELARFACDRGSDAACGNLGAHYADGLGVPHDEARALDLLRRACGANVMESCTGVAIVLLRQGVRNDAVARIWLTKACGGAEPSGCFELGKVFSRHRNMPVALELFQKACALGSRDGCAAVSKLKSAE